jgi:hypothetical protein
MRRIFTTAVAVGVAAAGVALPARAQTDETAIDLGGQVVMRIRIGAGGYTPQQRADAVRARLTPILGFAGLKAADVTVRQTRPGQDAAIYVRDSLLITVDRSLAGANGTTPEALARVWADRLRTVLPRVAARPEPAEK